MKASYDAETDALYVRFSADRIVESEEVRPGLVLDYDSSGKIVAMEFLNARTHLPPAAFDDIKAA